MLQKISGEAFPEVFKSPFRAQIVSILCDRADVGVHVCELCQATGLKNRAARQAVEEIRRGRDDRNVRMVAKLIRRGGVVVCADEERGYFLPADREELFLWLRRENKRAASITRTLRPAMALFDDKLKTDLISAGAVEDRG